MKLFRQKKKEYEILQNGDPETKHNKISKYLYGRSKKLNIFSAIIFKITKILEIDTNCIF